MLSRCKRARKFCDQCQLLQLQRSSYQAGLHSTSYSRSTASPKPKNASPDKNDEVKDAELGPLARKLQEATEETLLTGGRAGRRAIEDAGFSDELKEKLLNKIAQAGFTSQDSGASFSTKGTPFSAAAESASTFASSSRPWTGEESTPDAVLRMLHDAKPTLKPELRGGNVQPGLINTRIRRGQQLSAGQKVSRARDKASAYSEQSSTPEHGLSAQEKEEMKREFRERFEPNSRPVAATISGMAALANERIERAMASGQFKHIQRGTAVERDVMDNPFVDTTEYLMNRIIKRQDIVPPWIEKQQELNREAERFRERLRNDWKRHAARMIASRGGSLQDQIKRAVGYAESERLHNPVLGAEPMAAAQTAQPTNDVGSNVEESGPLPKPFRDAEWEKTEFKYMNLAIERLNNMTRSYNLMAPDLAKKPYFSLERELASCYANTAPKVAKEIQERATRPASTTLSTKARPANAAAAGITGHLGGKDNVSIHLEADEKGYGLRDWWQDVWKKEK